VTTDRCPACNAAVTAGAQWCTLCYADLRVRETVPAGPVAPVVLPGVPVADEPVVDEPVVKAAAISGKPVAGWPCLGCGALVPLADNVCPQCFRPFLTAEELPSLELPGVGDLTRMSRGQRILIASILASVVSALLLAMGFIAGIVL
jgi:RNA polymerase subunit RPABC4/transcription elongation factor Spt4